MLAAVAFTIIGFVFAIALGLLGAWSAGHVGASIGVSIGLCMSFVATAYVASR